MRITDKHASSHAYKTRELPEADSSGSQRRIALHTRCMAPRPEGWGSRCNGSRKLAIGQPLEKYLAIHEGPITDEVMAWGSAHESGITPRKPTAGFQQSHTRDRCRCNKSVWCAPLRERPNEGYERGSRPFFRDFIRATTELRIMLT